MSGTRSRISSTSSLLESFELVDPSNDDDDDFSFGAPDDDDFSFAPPKAYAVITNHTPAPRRVIDVATQIVNSPPKQLADISLQTKSTPDLAAQKPAWLLAREQQKPNNSDGFLINRVSTSFASLASQRPTGHKSIRDLGLFESKTQKVQTVSFHKAVVYEDAEENPSYIFKANPDNPAMSEIEPMCVGFFRLIAPNYFPNARPIFDDKKSQLTGLCSKVIEGGFHSLHDNPITEDDLLNDAFVEGLAVSLTTSYIMMEGDLHRQNQSKTGLRIDGDGLLWPLLCQIKNCGIVDLALRTPTSDTYVITEKDIRNFPDLTDAKPYYWPTRSDRLLQTLKSAGANVTANMYTPKDNELFKKLTTNKVFIYHKYKTLLKFLLTYPDMYRMDAERNVSKKTTLNGRSFIDVAVETIEQRRQSFYNVLVKMDEFQEFMRSHGRQALLEITAEFNKRNDKFSDKFSKHPERTDYNNRLINIGEIDSRYDKVLKDCQDYSDQAVNSFRTH